MGIGIVLFCAYIFNQKKTTIKPFQESIYLVRESIFSHSKNPIYLGRTITLIGVGIFLGSLTPLFIIPVFRLLIRELFIKEEERMLEAKFSESYQEYQATVRR